jgi:translation initiation factor 4G
MLTEGIMFDCINTLLKKPQEDNIECLCKLMTSIGKDLDNEKNKVEEDVFS